MFSARKYFVRLPVDYDHSRPYPIVFYGPGCGASNVEPTPMMNQIKNDAIHVFLLQKSNCFSTGYPSPEVQYFTQALDEVQAKYCSDERHVYVSGYSSGAWLSNLLACAMGSRIRGIGTAAGGLRKATIDGYKCPAPAVGIFYTGENDNENPADRRDENGFQYGVLGARDRLLATNGCDATANETWSENPICQIWKKGCEMNPVVYCVGPGDGHGKGDGNFNVSNRGFWDLWRSVP
jgi:poly(3-hydroxybutyrate) depolymerase